ncbi:MAG: SDR family oxidoreductase [Chloroflexota bacterium]
MEMTTQTLIVTGASDGLGAAIAEQLGKLHANVVITARRQDALEQTAERVIAAGGQVRIVAGDITEAFICKKLVQTAVEAFGMLDVVVNNAGVLDPLATVADGQPNDWRHTFEVNLFGPLTLTQAALPHLRKTENPGRIINVSSGAAVASYPTWGAYGATKAALNHLTATISAEEPNVTAIALRPGVIDTAMQRQIRDEGKDIMPDALYDRFMQFHEGKVLLPPEKPGFAAAVLALHAPPDWSGQFMNWDDELLRRLAERHYPAVTETPGNSSSS